MSDIVRFFNGWQVEQHGDHQDNFLHITMDGKPGYITIKKEHEGFVIDVWPDVGNDSVATCAAPYDELQEVTA